MTPRRRWQVGLVTLGLVGLLLPGATVAQQPPDRSTPPALGPTPRLELPPVVERTLSNGLQVWVVESSEVPLVQVSLLVRAGGGEDPAGRFGLASMTAAMLDEGAGRRSALELADAVEFLGANLTTSGSFDASTIRLNVPVARLSAGLALMADVALRPSFPAEELERLRQERLTDLLQARDDARSVATMAFARIVYGEGHRYGTGTTGTPETIRAFAPDDLREFHATWYRPERALLVVAGDVRTDAVVPQLESHFGSWRGNGTVVARALPADVARGTDRRVYIVDMPGAAQSEIRIGWVGVPRSTPDYFPLQVLNTVLGGAFTSRLNQNLREEHGYTYGASSRFDMRLAAGPFVAGAGVQTDRTADALREFFNELEGILAPVGDDELVKARNYVALGFPGEFETIGDMAGHLEELAVYDLPEDFFLEYIPNIQAVTASDLQQAAAAHLDPARFVVVVAGDRAEIETGIRALGLGPVETLTVDDAIGR